MKVLTDESRIRYEYRWSNHAAKYSLNASEHALWLAHRHSSRTFFHPRRRYVVWTKNEGCAAQVLDVLQLAQDGHRLSMARGIELQVTRRSGDPLTITSIPSKLPGLDVFLWVPAINDVRWAPLDYDEPSSERLLRVAVNFKQSRSPQQTLVEGVQYFSELATFAQLFPEYVKL